MTNRLTFALAVVLLAILLLGMTAQANGTYTQLLPLVAKDSQVSTCRVVLFEDGSWLSPDYQVGDPWPPTCQWVVANNE